MREITLSADEELIERASKRATREQMSLNEAFQKWLEQYATIDQPATETSTRPSFEEVMRRLSYVKFDRKFTRDEMNER
jgi:hypothetical protein